MCCLFFRPEFTDSHCVYHDQSSQLQTSVEKSVESSNANDIQSLPNSAPQPCSTTTAGRFICPPSLPAAGGNTKADRASADHSAAEGGELGEAGAGATFYFTLPPLSFGRWKIAGQTRKGGGNGRSRGWSRDTRRASEGRGTVITRMVPWETQLLFVVCTPEACFPNCHRVSAQTTFSLPLFSFFAQLRNFPPFPFPPATTFSLFSSPSSPAFFSLTVSKQRLIGSS